MTKLFFDNNYVIVGAAFTISINLLQIQLNDNEDDTYYSDNVDSLITSSSHRFRSRSTTESIF